MDLPLDLLLPLSSPTRPALAEPWVVLLPTVDWTEPTPTEPAFREDLPSDEEERLPTEAPSPEVVCPRLTAERTFTAETNWLPET